MNFSHGTSALPYNSEPSELSSQAFDILKHEIHNIISDCYESTSDPDASFLKCLEPFQELKGFNCFIDTSQSGLNTLNNLLALAKSNTPETQCKLAQKYYDNFIKRVSPDLGKAEYWFSIAAMKGHSHAQEQLRELHGKWNIISNKYGDKQPLFWFEETPELHQHMTTCDNCSTSITVCDFIQHLADKQDVNAQNALGIMYRDGRLCTNYNGSTKYAKQDEDKAIYWFCKAANQGHPQALYNLAMMLKNKLDQDSTHFDSTDSLPNQNLKQIQSELPDFVRKEDNVKHIIFHLCYSAAKKEHPLAQYELAVMYRDTIAPLPLVKTSRFSQQAYLTEATSNNPYSFERKLIEKFLPATDSQHTEISNEIMSLYWLISSAIQGYSVAQHTLAIWYRDEKAGSIQNLHRHFFWLTESAYQDNSNAKLDLALAFRQYKKHAIFGHIQSLLWLKSSAEQNNPLALFELAIIYSNSTKKLQQENTLAFLWLTLAADQGHIQAAFELIGIFCKNNAPPTQDAINVSSWLLTMAKQLFPKSQYILPKIYFSRSDCSSQDKTAPSTWLQNMIKLCYDTASKSLKVVQEAKFGLAKLLQNGCEQTTSTSLSSVLKLLQEAAVYGHSQAQYNLGVLYKKELKNLAGSPLVSLYWLQKAAEQGHIQAQHDLALIYLHGTEYVPKNRVLAIYWLNHAALQNEPRAIYELTVIGRGQATTISTEPVKNIRILHEAAEAGHPQAQYDLSIMLRDGTNQLRQNLPLAMKHLQQAANSNHVQALYELSMMYRDNIEGLPNNNSQVLHLKYLKQAADSGHTIGQYALYTSLLYLKYQYSKHHKGVAEYCALDPVVFLHQAAEKLYSPALCELALRNLQGIGNRPSISRVGYYLKLAATQGNARACYDLFILQRNGINNIFENPMEFLYWLKVAATLGQAQAQYELSVLYLYGTENLAQDPTLALHWLKLSATSGYAQAQYELAISYRDGTAYLLKNESFALHYLTLAAAQNHNNAQFALAMMYKLGIKNLSAEENLKHQLDYLIAAAENKHAPAQYHLFNLLTSYRTLGLKDYKYLKLNPLIFLEKAAETGYIPALHDLGAMHRDGSNGISKNHHLAIQLFEKAAAKHCKASISALDRLHYINKTGTKKRFCHARPITTPPSLFPATGLAKKH